MYIPGRATVCTVAMTALTGYGGGIAHRLADFDIETTPIPVFDDAPATLAGTTIYRDGHTYKAREAERQVDGVTFQMIAGATILR
jgi:hypothetical protein